MKTMRGILLMAGLFVAPVVMADMSEYYGYQQWDAIDFRQQRQQERIVQGIETGLLTSGEINKLEKQQRKIAKLERRFKGDGRLTLEEMGILQRKLDNLSQTINALKRNHRIQRYDNRYRYSARYALPAQSRAGCRS